LMALRLDPVRLLIADDVGVGKTIEAGLIARELWDAHEIRRLVVLCPPPLTDQWATELQEKFHFDPVVLAPATLGALERSLPHGRSLYRHYPVIVASIDFLKLPRHREPFLVEPPDLVIVDEAHGVVPASAAQEDPRHRRYELVAELARDPRRHLLLLTATPHSGIQRAFQRLLGLLDPAFSDWDLDHLDEPQRKRLARHFVQRTRADIRDQWPEAERLYPERQVVERTYQLSPAYRALFEETFAVCRRLVEKSRELPEHERRFQWWAALTLLRCVMSSPRAGAEALARREPRPDGPPLSAEEPLAERVEDLSVSLEPTEQPPNDEVPTQRLEFAADSRPTVTVWDRRQLRRLAQQAKALEQTPEE
ncbi:MAG: DEAD/DEAH box helicase, partial [Thermomicrobium sp.]|nr:DEAD/DEAH box helicase [Thermomicrobium sp.]